MSYQVPQHINKDKIFIVNRSEIEGRLDPHSYHNERKDAIKRIKETGNYLPLSSVVSFKKLISTDMKSGDVYVGLENIISDTGEYVKTIEKQSISSAAVFKKGDILFPKLRPYLNKVFYATFNGLCSTEFYVLKSNGVNSQYLSIFLRSSLIVNQTKHLMTGNTLPRLQTEDVRSLLIPIPSADTQRKIVDCYMYAYNHKLQKDAEARQLLDSIDVYLLKELGISMPKIQRDLDSRIFIVQKKDLKGRYTPNLYKDAVTLHSTIYQNIPLSHLAYINPSTRFPNRSKEIQISFVPMESVNEIYAEITDHKDCLIEEAKGFTRFQEGDLLWAKITPCMENGKSAIAKGLTNGYGCGSTEFHVIRPKNDELLIEYIHSLLHMKFVRQTAKLYFGGSAGQQRVAVDFLEDFNVPLPSREKQKEIIDHIAYIRTRAKSLQEEGKNILDDAKRQVEQMIIGY